MFRTAEMRPVSGASFTPGPWCSHGCHLDFSHHCRLPAAGPFPRYCFHLPEFWVTELAEVHSRSPFPVFPLPVTSGWNAGPWAFSRASHPAVTSDACQERERALSTRPELTADQSTLHSSYLTQTVRPHVAPRYASSRRWPPATSWTPSPTRCRPVGDRADTAGTSQTSGRPGRPGRAPGCTPSRTPSPRRSRRPARGAAGVPHPRSPARSLLLAHRGLLCLTWVNTAGCPGTRSRAQPNTDRRAHGSRKRPSGQGPGAKL